jgi:hypothetical protein
MLGTPPLSVDYLEERINICSILLVIIDEFCLEEQKEADLFYTR